MIQKYKHVIPTSISRLFALFILTASLTAIPFVSFASPANAQTKLTADSYCKQYKDTSEKYACVDGWKGVDCSDYLITHDQAHVDICQASAREAANNNSGGDSEESLGTSIDPDTNNSNNTDNLDTVQDLIKNIQDTQQKYGLDSKRDKDPDNIPDNNYGAYINGNGDKQQLRIKKAATKDRAPAIIFINGGGWHYDDQVGDKISDTAVARGYTAIVATYRLGSSGIYYQYDDVMRAIKHVRNNAAMYNVDAGRIAIWGDSAGGSLVMRAAGSGKSGAKAAVGWSAPTNGFTGLFKSPQSFAIGLDHSTCIPTDINGAANTLNILAGGNGDAPNTGGVLNNGINTETGKLNPDDDPLSTLGNVLTLAQRARDDGLNPLTMAQNLAQTGSAGVSDENIQRLTAKKYSECLQNFEDMSPALFASPLTPPTFLAGFDRDVLVDPGQLYQMRDKLRGMGVPSSVLTLPGVASPTTVAGENHLDYNKAFVDPTLNFLDKYLHPKKQ